ncbi:hypothetical protein AVEN_217526-1 [Araneus ventricosus]|uniref:Uncharacterized protein n=1 Tax=Araneus ventricosus TaxID=182803 RepID=A0A4Y2NX17_ARAVE|nr:hypothetical protein AVEN_274874-1 [Araneus ventricosus]GBN43594.1 hypothetical protein AVEN_51901-1 [Araneus ventricosus]GBN43617.1 hypothetical protein AVEN_126495-1 [Araneus ventricosus]GBN43666.1 hypothetical protein AVEN_217526-1 [Araneus ventricosus]
MMKTLPQLTPPLKISASHQQEDVCNNVKQDHIHGRTSMESGFEPGTLRPPKPRTYHYANTASSFIEKRDKWNEHLSVIVSLLSNLVICLNP